MATAAAAAEVAAEARASVASGMHNITGTPTPTPTPTPATPKPPTAATTTPPTPTTTNPAAVVAATATAAAGAANAATAAAAATATAAAPATATPPAEPTANVTATVTHTSLLQGYARLRDRILQLKPDADLTAFDTAVQHVRDLPHDDEGFFTLPADLPSDATDTVPAANDSTSRMSPDPSLHALGETERLDAVAAGALRWARRRNGLRRCMHRLFAVWRSGTNRQRARLIADLRPLNSLMPPPPPFTLPRVVDCLPWSTVRFATKTDLDSAFWTLALSAAAAAAMTTQDGREWAALPFGFSWSPYIFHVALNPVPAAMEALGYAVVKYLDDFLLADADQLRCDRGTTLLRSFLTDLGFKVSAKKSSPVPEQRLVFLGIGIDLARQWFFWPADKAFRVADDARAFLAAGRVAAADLQSWLGRVAFLCTVCPLLACWRRSLEDAIANAGDAAVINITASTAKELQFWVNRATSLAGATFPWPTGDRWVVRTDASDTAGGVTVLWPSGHRTYYSFLLPPSLRLAASAARECYVTVTAIDVLLSRVGARPLFRARIDVYTDATSSAAALARGGKAPSMLPHTQRALAISHSLAATITPRWLPRAEMQAEDDLSKRMDYNELRMHPDIVRYLCRLAWDTDRPAFDLFAAAANRHTSAYASRVPEDGAAVDGLRTAVPPQTWAYPPLTLGRRAARHISDSASPSLMVFTGNDGLTAAATLPGAVWRIDVSDMLLLQPPHFTAAIPSPARPLTVIAYRTRPLPHNVTHARLRATWRDATPHDVHLET